MISDESIICGFMEPRPALPTWCCTQQSPLGWWELAAIAGRSREWDPVRLTFDRLYAVEERLTEGQWLQYSVCCWKWYTEAATANDYEISFLNRWRKVLLHLSAAQKIKALAAAIRVSNPREDIPNSQE